MFHLLIVSFGVPAICPNTPLVERYRTFSLNVTKEKIKIIETFIMKNVVLLA